MKQNFFKFLFGAALACTGLAAKAQGLEGIVVEDYYTITAADASYLSGIGTYPINAGAKVYRIYVDMAPNYKLNTVNGSPLPQGGGPSPNPLDFTTTTTFWNENGFGSEVPPQTARFDDGAAFDSYITIGTTGRSGFTAGCGTNTQQVGTLKTADTNGNLTLCSVYQGFPSGAGTPDGNIPGTVPALTYNLGGLVDFTALTASASSFTVVGDAWATLPNGPGVDPTGTNRVLIAQLTTDGTLTFHINVQLQAPGGALETYVWNQAGAGEQVKNFLTFPAPPAPDCLGVLGGSALPGTACDDLNACTLNDVWSPACVCAGVLPAANWDMATAASNANTIANTTTGNITSGNNNGTTTLITSTSASSGYPGATGTNNAGAAAFTGALTASSTYFQFSLTPSAGTIFTLNGLSFGTRSTGTGAQAYTVRTSADGFVANVATGSIQNNSVWSLKSNTGLSVASLNGQPLTVRIYGHNGSGSPSMNTANWRIDDLTVSGCNTPAPPTTTGCSSSQSPYILPIGAGRTTTSILTVGDAIGGYPLVGLPDGMGAFDNNNGTFTLLVNHEIGNTQGVARAHGSIGAFVSKFVINKSNLCVQSGADLINTVQLWNGTGYTAGTTAFNRFCAGDLADVSAFYNAGTGKGTQERIYLNGEEAGAEGRAFGHIVSGPNTGVSYELPYLGRFSWENAIASPATGDKTVVAGTDDATPGQVYMYIGTKQNTGNEIEKAGLDDGKLYGVAVSGLATEVSGSFIAPNTPFTLFDLGNVANTTGAALNTASNSAGVTNFLRPEDGAWDISNPSDFYFVTTNGFNSPSRMYRLRFTDILQPELGGTITAVLDGTESVGQQMMDNMCIDTYGQAMIQEDPGNQAYLARIHKYDIATDAIVEVATHDASRFVTGGANFLTQDEESSGIIDMKNILGPGRYIINDQAHYNIPGALVQGGQLLELRTGDTTNVCVPPTIAAITAAQTICSTDVLALNAAGNGTPTLSYSWSGTGSFLFGSGNASALVTGAASGTYTVTVSNACGTATGTVNVTVTPAATYYADVDGDGFGDPAVDSLSCTLPVGYVTNNTDNCPAVSGVIGSACDDNDACTTGDVLNANCGCAGTPSNLVANCAHTDVTCNGLNNGTVTVSSTGGTGTITGTGLFTNLAPGPYSYTVTDAAGCQASCSSTVTEPTILTASVTTTPVSTVGGSDGTATANVGGGSLPYTYLWSPGGQTTQTITGLNAGGYSVVVTDDNGCTVSASGTVNSPNCNLGVTISHTDVQCFGGSTGTATANVTGATGPVSFLWSPTPPGGQTTQTIIGLTAGTYSVNITDGLGCTSSASQVVGTAPQLVPSSSVGTFACGTFTAPVTIDASGGTLPYSGTGTFNQAPGTTSYTVTDGNGCTASISVTVTAPDADNDGTSDCTDGCPADPNKIAPGQCGCGVADTDTDGDGVANCVDNCPNVAGQIGSACNDGNANTINDVLDASCVCVGTPVAGCTQNEVTLTLTTDANGSQTSYSIVNIGTTTVVCSGSGYASNSTIPVTCCLPNGCYELRVFDSAGDGIVPGGYILTDANGKRIIDNANNGAFGSISTIVSNLGFCVPLGSDALQATSCDVQNATLSTVLRAVVNPAVSAQFGISNSTSGYQFWVFNPNGSYSRRIFFSHAAPGSGAPFAAPAAEKASYFRLSAMASPSAIPQGVLLNVRVRTRLNGTYSEFGPACRLLLPVPVCQTTQLTTTASPLVSCGAVNVNRTTGVLWANAVAGANRYQFEFVNGNTNVLLRRIASPTRNLNMSTWGTGVVLPTCNVPYNVRVRVSFDGGATYCPFGSFCTVTYACSAVEDGRAQEPGMMESTSVFTMYPNPNRGDELFVSLNGFDVSVNTVSVDIYDALGQRVFSNIIPVDGGMMNTALDLRSDIASGLYMVNVTAGNVTKTERLVIQR